MTDLANMLTEAELNGVIGGEMKTCKMTGVGIDLPNGGILIIRNTDCGSGHLIPSAAYVPPSQ